MNGSQITKNSSAIQFNEYSQLVEKISLLWDNAKTNAAYAVNTELLLANWQTGQYIVEFEQNGKARAEYGAQLLINLSKDLTAKHGRGFSRSNLTYMRKLYLAFPKCETLSHKLTWSHYFELLKCDDPLELQFYYTEAIKESWKVRELKRQIKSSLFQRLALSTDKAGILSLATEGHQVMTADDIIHDPYVLEFAGLPKKRKYKEAELEDALKAKHEDIGQMNLYLNYFKTEICQSDDNPPIGIVLGAKKDELLMEYAMQGITNQLFAARYQLYLPKREELQAQLDRMLED
jgi:Uncharacterized conserved protein